MNFRHAGRMTEQVKLYRKATSAEESPTEWVQLAGTRRAQIDWLSDNAALAESNLLQAQVTHHAFVDADDDYKAQTGSRVLKHVETGKNFWIVRVAEAGHRGRAGTPRYLRLSLAEVRPEVV